MKNLINKTIIGFVLMFGLQGCYTVLWSPDREFPNASNSSQTYNNYYIGDHYYYYNSPWWYRITPPVAGYDTHSDRNADNGSLRNSDGGRGGGTNTILNPGTPGRSSGGSGNTVTPPKSSDKGSDSSSGSSRSGSGNNSSGSDTRNNDGGRNSDKGKR